MYPLQMMKEKKHSESVIPDSFSDYFTNIANQLTSQIPPSQYTAASFPHDRIQNNFVISPISPIEVNSIIDDLKIMVIQSTQ